MKPTLLVLAAGMGSRYGGLKQMDTLGPGGETIIDYSIYDAVRAGFGKVVYIVREYFREEFEKTVKEKYANVKCADGSPLEFVFVTQELDKIPSGYNVNPERQKPWGTAHAVLMAKDVIKEPFAVINGDDFYGRDSFQVLGDWLRAHSEDKGRFSIVGFALENTLSESGGVSRGICFYDSNKQLTDVVEHLNIAREVRRPLPSVLTRVTVPIRHTRSSSTSMDNLPTMSSYKSRMDQWISNLVNLFRLSSLD